MSFATELRRTIEATLVAYENADGMGRDAYHEAPIRHPMADGKYLQAMAALRRTDLLSPAEFEMRVGRACARLEASALSSLGKGACWGLGFPWNNLPASEPFLITSAIVARGVLDCHSENPGLAGCDRLLSNALEGLRAWSTDLAVRIKPEVVVPIYSPSLREAIYNPIAYAYATMKVAKDCGCTETSDMAWQPVLDWIRSTRIDALGWPYSGRRPVIDLVHQCYILNALADGFGGDVIESDTIELIGQFAYPDSYVDALRVRGNALEQEPERNIPWLRRVGNVQIEVVPKHARLWSLGELLVLVSRLCQDGERRDAWNRLGLRIAKAVHRRLTTPDDPEAEFPRQVMHAVHGMATFLEAGREKAKSVQPPTT